MLGQKIKSLRLAKGMTQAALAGTTITRNMLSQIENGVAQPSVATIVELAEKLNTPVEYFFSDSTDLDAFLKIGAIARIRKLYASGDFARCIARLDALGISDDETELLYANAYFERGRLRHKVGELSEAAEDLRRAFQLSPELEKEITGQFHAGTSSCR
jgi:transcriptional regulator with XRE-family HTH domain